MWGLGSWPLQKLLRWSPIGSETYSLGSQCWSGDLPTWGTLTTSLPAQLQTNEVRTWGWAQTVLFFKALQGCLGRPFLKMLLEVEQGSVNSCAKWTARWDGPESPPVQVRKPVFRGPCALRLLASGHSRRAEGHRGVEESSGWA